jgi:hypothetical protein
MPQGLTDLLNGRMPVTSVHWTDQVVNTMTLQLRVGVLGLGKVESRLGQCLQLGWLK